MAIMTCSCTLPVILERYRDLLAAGGRWRPGRPSVNVNSRGNLGMDVVVRTASRDLHSGCYGGPVGNAASVLARILATPHDHSNRIPEFAEIGRLLARIFQAGPGAPKDAMVANRFADVAAAHPVPSFVE